MKNKIVIISGITASGKSGLALHLAKKINGVIINADSMQIYKGLPILSAQPTQAEQNEVPHLLYSHLEPTQNCSVGNWLDLVQNAIKATFDKNQTPIIVGGTGMYISKLMYGILEMPTISEKTRQKTKELYSEIGHEKFYEKVKQIDPKAVSKLALHDKQRLMRIYEIYAETHQKLSDIQKQPNQIFYPRAQFFHININPPRDNLYKKCDQRFKKIIQETGLKEVENFIKNYPEIICHLQDFSVSKTLGFCEILQYLNKEINQETMMEKATQKIRNYAKRQYTWFKNQFKDKDLEINEIITKNNLDKITEEILKRLKS